MNLSPLSSQESTKSNIQLDILCNLNRHKFDKFDLIIHLRKGTLRVTFHFQCSTRTLSKSSIHFQSKLSSSRTRQRATRNRPLLDPQSPTHSIERVGRPEVGKGRPPIALCWVVKEVGKWRPRPLLSCRRRQCCFQWHRIYTPKYFKG